MEGFDFKLFHEKVGYEGTDGGFHGCTMDLFIVLILEEEVDVFEAELKECDYLWNGHLGSLEKGGVLGESLFYYIDCWVHWN